jgi:3'(2'), 5'-bisphosphate nucleotidase
MVASAWRRANVDRAALLDELALAAREAGEAILTIVRRGFEVEAKSDSSPVTEADRAAELVILAALAQLAPGVPVIAEEEVAAGRVPAHGDSFFLVDPLDGTKEFVRGGDDYTVNIALVEKRETRLGVVFAPATGRLHGGVVGQGAWLEDGSGRQPIRTRALQQPAVAVASKSHFTQATADYLEQAVGAPGGHVSIGSSLKFCLVAEGAADIYPRLSPTSEWDTAAGHAVLLAAGGRVDGADGGPLLYGKPTFLNRGFVATGGWEPTPIEPFLKPFSGGGDLPQGV